LGVKIKDILEVQTIDFSFLNGKTIAIDAANALYQFLSIIQPTTGLPLMDSQKRVTSHLSGLFYRTINLIERGIKPIYVFDGKPPALKQQTIKDRKEGRESAYEQWKEALDKGDVEAARKYGQAAHRLTRDMVKDAKELLNAMGVPIVQALTEGEAQGAFMATKKDIYAVASQDYDSLLFGAPLIVRNLSLAEKRRIPRTNQYIKVEPELINTVDNLERLKITREQLIDIGILVGTDFNDGVKGVGAKTALKLVLKYGDLETILEEKSYEIENTIEELQQIRNFFLQPEIIEDYDIQYTKVNVSSIKNILVEEHEFSLQRVEKALKRLEKQLAKKGQTKLEKWF
jgi:flap endonuclease-1